MSSGNVRSLSDSEVMLRKYRIRGQAQVSLAHSWNKLKECFYLLYYWEILNLFMGYGSAMHRKVENSMASGRKFPSGNGITTSWSKEKKKKRQEIFAFFYRFKQRHLTTFGETKWG